MSLPESTTHLPPPAPLPHLTSVVPASVQERAAVKPPAEWVAAHPVDESFHATNGGPYSVLLLDRQHHAAQHARYERTVQRLENLQAVQDASQWRLDFDPATQRVALHSLATLRAGQRTEHAQPERFRFLQREEQLDRFVLHGLVTLVVLLEDVRVGDVLDASFTVRTEPRLLRDRRWLFAVVPAFTPVRAFRLSLRFPAGEPMRWKSCPEDFAPTIREFDGETEWSWLAENTTAAEPEPNVPAWQLPPHWVQASSCASWAEVAAGVLAAWEEDWHDDEFSRAVEEIAAATPSPAPRVERALTLVQDEIRYLSVNIELGGQIPSPPGATLRRRFGDCKDKSFLLAHLLRRLGVSARPVLVNTSLRQAVEDLLPTPDLFNHAVIEYELAGQRRWADATLPLQGGGALARLTPDFRMGLPISAGVAGLEPVAPPDASQGHYELRETYALSTASRPTTLTIVVTARGWDAEELRRSLALEGRETMAKKREQFYRQLFPEVLRTGALESRDDRERNEIVLAEAYELPGAFSPAGDGLHAMFRCRAHLIHSVLGFPDSAARQQPLALPYPCSVEHIVEIVSPALPRAQARKSRTAEPAFRFTFDPVHSQGRWALHFRLKTLADSVPPDRWDWHKRLVRELWPTTLLQVLLPINTPAPWKKRHTGSLLPSARAATRAMSAPAEMESDATRCETPAPALASIHRPAPAESAPAPAAAQPPPLPKTAAASAPLFTAGPAAAVAQARVGRHHRRRRRKRRNWWAIAALTLMAAMMIAIWVMVLRRSPEDDRPSKRTEEKSDRPSTPPAAEKSAKENSRE